MINLLFTHLYLMQGKINRSLICISSKQRIFWSWIHNFSVCQLIHKKTYPPLVRWTAEYVFLYRWSYKNSCWFQWIWGSVFVLCYSCEITQNMVFQLLKNSKVEINFGWSHPDKSIFWLFASTLENWVRVTYAAT